MSVAPGLWSFLVAGRPRRIAMEALGYTGSGAHREGESLEDILRQRLLAQTPSLHPLVG
jgi:hypothetical protein